MRDVDYLDNGIGLRNANLNSNFSFDNNELALTRIAARLLGGQITGDADVKNLLPAAPAPQPAPAGQLVTTGKQPSTRRPRDQRQASQTVNVNDSSAQVGSARLRVSGLSLSELAGMMSTRSLPLNKLNPVGSVAGSVNLSWKRSLNDLLADLALDVTAPAQVANHQLPVNGSLRGRQNERSGVIDIAVLNLTTPHTHLEAAGTLGTTSAALKLAVRYNQPHRIPTTFVGHGQRSSASRTRAERRASMAQSTTESAVLILPDICKSRTSRICMCPVRSLRSRAKVAPQAKRKSWFHLASTPQPPTPAPPVVQPRKIHIDQFSGDIQYSAAEVALHHALIQEGGAQLNLDGTTTLDKGNFTENSQFQVQAAMQNADVAGLQRAAGFDYPVSGKLNFTLQVAGTGTELARAWPNFADRSASLRPSHQVANREYCFRESWRSSGRHSSCRPGAASSRVRPPTISLITA